MTEASTRVPMMTMPCSYCGAEISIEQVADHAPGRSMTFELGPPGKRSGTYTTRIRLTGCPHADAWNRGPRGGPGLPLPKAA